MFKTRCFILDVKLNSLIIYLGCCAAAHRVPLGLIELRDHVAKYLEPKSLKWDLSTLIISYTNLCSDIKSGNFSNDYYVEASLELDARFEAICLNAPASWQYSTGYLDQKTERCFTSHFDIYPGRHVAQAWNVIRLVRILLNEYILENSRAPSKELPDACSPSVARGKIAKLALEICASVPQYVDCFGIARRILQMGENSQHSGVLNMAVNKTAHVHTPAENLACYILIFPLAVAGQSVASPKGLKSWIINELRYMANHFDIRNAEVVARILEGGAMTNPWDVYALLGSYAFVA